MQQTRFSQMSYAPLSPSAIGCTVGERPAPGTARDEGAEEAAVNVGELPPPTTSAKEGWRGRSAGSVLQSTEREREKEDQYP